MSLDQEQTEVIITLNELQSLTYEEVSDCVSQETALEICKRSLEDLSAKHVDLLSLWLRKLLKAYFYKSVCCMEVFKCLYVWFTKLKDEVTAENKIGCDHFYKLLTDALDFAEWAKGRLAKVGERLGHTAVYFLLSIVSSCLHQRLEESSKTWRPADIAQAVEYYSKCTNLYAMFSRHTSQWHVQRMLKYFHKLEHKEAPLFNMKNYCYLHCVSPRAEQDRRMWMMRLQRILITPLNDVEQYYEMLALMELSATDQNDWLRPMLDSVKNIINNNKCQLLRQVFFKLGFHSNQLTQQRLLQDAMPTQDIINKSWHMQKILYVAQRSDVNELKSLAGTRTVATDLLPLLGALHSPQTIASGPVLHNKWEYKRAQRHRCNLGNLKRKRSEKPKQLICELDRNAKELFNCSEELDASDLQQLRSLIKNLNQLLLI
ncbi:hypothetical protein KR044_005331 [Drosophila immigrans]|nr:hypothetical protein KR044_005331 [Drosophila immigrans]